MRGPTGRRTVSRPPAARRTVRRTRSWVVLSLVVLAILLLVVYASLRSRPEPAPSGTSAATTQKAATASASVAATTRAAAETAGNAYDDPLMLDLASRVKVAVPEPFVQQGWTLVRQLPDGRLILNSGRRLSIFDPATGAEKIVKEAEFGIQAAANDRFLAFGVGGDEMTEVSLHYIAEDYTEIVLQDSDGFLDLEMTRAGGLLASRIRYTGEEAVLDAWIRFGTDSYDTAVLSSAERSYARYLFAGIYPDKSTIWTYDIGKAWHDTWLDAAEQLFYAKVVRSGRNDSSFHLYRPSPGGQDTLLYSRESGMLPLISVSHNLLSVDRSTAFRTDTGRWLHASFEQFSAEGFPHGGSLVAANPDGILVAALDRFGRLGELYRLPPVG